jgi:hypothetical protein
MKTRFEPGDRFNKKPYAGFVGEAIPNCYIPFEDNDPDPCFLCEDPKCREYPNCWILDENGTTIGHLCHVSECQMEEADGT